MSNGVNKVTLLGNLGADPDVQHMQDGKVICNLRVATSESWKDKQTGEKVTKTEWHRVSFFGPLAEVCAKWLKKGSKVYIEGSIHTRKWQDKDGQDRYTTGVRGRDMLMLGDASRQEDKAQSSAQDYAQGKQDISFDTEVPF